MQLTSFLSGAVPGTILTLSTAAIFLYGGKLVIDRQLTIGTLVAVMSYHLRLLSPVQNLMSLYSNLVSGGVSLSRVWELFDTRAEIADRPGGKPLANVRGEIEFDGVSFGYGGEAVLEMCRSEWRPGTICAILGPSGVGKSTLADLLVRFYDPDQAPSGSTGTICAISGSPICVMRFCWWIKRPIFFTPSGPREYRLRAARCHRR